MMKCGFISFQTSFKSRFIRYLNELVLQFEDGQTLSLLQDGEFRLLAIRHLVPTEGVSLPRWEIDGHSADASHVGSDLPSLICTGEGTERPERGQIFSKIHPNVPESTILFNQDELQR